MSQDAYELLDAGDGRKLERFGRFVLDRPCAQAVWHPQREPQLWARADAFFTREHGARWQFRAAAVRNGWNCVLEGVNMALRPTDFGHVGIFPEHSFGWAKMQHALRAAKRPAPPSVLNLFAYTGGATLAAAAAGAQVTHVDASKGMVGWAKENAAASGLSDAPIRWLVDDCVKFVEREIRRGNKYDAIIMDPPSYGRGPKGETWKIEDNVFELIRRTSLLLSDAPLFFLISSYTTGLQPGVLRQMLSIAFDGDNVEADELGLPVTTGGILPCGASGRVTF